MDHRTTFAAGLALGAGIMFLLDPDRGNRRRALVRDKAVRAGHSLDDAATELSQELRDRTRGALHETRARLREETVDDRVLEERVRAELGRLVTHPGSVEVHARDGTVTLRGPVLADEADRLLAGTRRVRGVQQVENFLNIEEEAGKIPGLQGEGRLE
jgi:osmotically-inducible protein OsmY